MRCPLLLCLPLFLLAMPMAAHSGSGSPRHDAVAGQNQAPSHSTAEAVPQDCDGMATLADKRVCHARQDQSLVDDCERLRPMRCKPYRDMHAAERALAEVEQSLIASARKAYASYADGDAAYVKDLEAAAREANRAWREYREAHCTMEPFAQGMSRDLAEHLTEACRVRMTRARINELKALRTATD